MPSTGEIRHPAEHPAVAVARHRVTTLQYRQRRQRVEGCGLAIERAGQLRQPPAHRRFEPAAQRGQSLARTSRVTFQCGRQRRLDLLHPPLAGPQVPEQCVPHSFASADQAINPSGDDGLQRNRQRIRQRVADWLGLPVCVGIAPTKTLAKLANHVAKKRSGYAGVCDLTRLSGKELDTLCAEIEVGEVWGVGRRIEERLSRIGVRSVQDLRHSDPDRNARQAPALQAGEG